MIIAINSNNFFCSTISITKIDELEIKQTTKGERLNKLNPTIRDEIVIMEDEKSLFKDRSIQSNDTPNCICLLIIYVYIYKS